MKVQNEDNQAVRSRKRPLSPTNSDSVPATGSKRTSSAQKLQEVAKIVEKLEEKHGGSYSSYIIEKLNACLHMGKHDSYDIPT